jgi:hypothetical protein
MKTAFYFTLFFITSVAGLLRLENPLREKCNTNENSQQIIHRFNGEVVYQHFSECFVIQIFKQSKHATYAFYMRLVTLFTLHKPYTCFIF